MDFRAYLAERGEMVTQALAERLPQDREDRVIVEAMRYSLLAPGKRVRPVLCLAGAEAVGGSSDDAMYCACALEMVHAYSLIHDDLPAMDDDALRRGQPTNHMVFGEGMAVLAGDGLLTQAMVLLSDPAATAHLEPAVALKVANLVGIAAGFRGMAGGQAADLLAEGEPPDFDRVRFIHGRKTGALLIAAIESGVIIGGGGPAQVETARAYGRAIGLAFQIKDDLQNVEGNSDEVNKPVGNDAARGKMTYPAVLGVEKARQMGEELMEEAVSLAGKLGPAGQPLVEMARFIWQRKN